MSQTILKDIDRLKILYKETDTVTKLLQKIQDEKTATRHRFKKMIEKSCLLNDVDKMVMIYRYFHNMRVSMVSKTMGMHDSVTMSIIKRTIYKLTNNTQK